MRFKDFTARATDEGGNGGFVGYAATFDREPDSVGDVIAKGAFTETLKAWADSGRPVPVLYGHNMEDPDYNIGTAELVEDERGLRTTAAFDGSPKAQRVRQLLAEGRLSKMSFAYDVLDEAPVELEDGTNANELRKLDLFEVSVVLVPANGHAEIIESKARKGGGAQDDATTLGDVLAVLNDIRDDLRAIAANDDNDNGDDADEGGSEEPGTANDIAKSRELIARINQAIL
nr:MAG TPA: prohead serine protease [Caudoviricetes sp.]